MKVKAALEQILDFIWGFASVQMYSNWNNHLSFYNCSTLFNILSTFPHRLLEFILFHSLFTSLYHFLKLSSGAGM